MPSPMFLAFPPDFPLVHLVSYRHNMSMLCFTIKSAISRLLAVSVPMFKVAILIFCSLARILLTGSARRSNLCASLSTGDALSWSGVCWFSSILFGAGVFYRPDALSVTELSVFIRAWNRLRFTLVCVLLRRY